MTTGRQAPPTNTRAKGIAREAALFVTFYTPREKEPGKVPPLYQRLKALIQRNPINKLSPCWYDLPAAQDTTAIWFAINAPDEDAAIAWETARQELQEILNDKDLPKDWWGYTLIYQAVLNSEVDLDSVPDELLSTVRRLESPESPESESLESESLESLEQADIAGGRVWLMGIPQGNGLAAATVYVALSPSDEETAFQQALLGPMLSMLDLIAHKGYRLRRQYRGPLEQDYEKGLNAFRESTYELLNDLGQQIEETDKLYDLARKHEVLVKFVSELKRLRISVAQQLPNYRWWQDQTGSNGITEYHYGHLDMAHQELELMVAQGQDALETANTAISMAQVQVDKEQEITQREIDEAQDKRQRRIEAVVTVLVLALALPHLLEPEAIRALLNVWLEWPVPHTDRGDLTVLWAQVVIMFTVVTTVVMVGALFLLVMRIVRPGASGKRRKPRWRPPHTT